MNRLSHFSRNISVFCLSVGTALMLNNVFAATPDPKGQPVTQQGLGIDDTFGKWPNGTITWVYNSTLAPDGYTDDNVALQRMQDALDEWEFVCGVRFISNGVDDSADITDTNDGVVVVQWENIASAGLAGPSWSGGQDVTGPGHIEYDDGTLRVDPATFALTGLIGDQITNRLIGFNQTFAHEIGHVLGLGHSSDHESIMFANPYNSMDHVRGDDIDSCRALYGFSDLYRAPEQYAPLPLWVSDPTDILYLAPASDTSTPTTNDLDGSLVPFADGDSLRVRWQITGGPYPGTLRQTIVDPSGYVNALASTEVTAPSGGSFSIVSFGRLREFPGDWVVHVDYAGSRVASLAMNVTAAPPTEIENPGATISYTENPATRATSVTVDVTSVSAAAVTPNQVTVDWHIGTVGNIQEVIAVPGQSTQNFTFGDSAPHEVHVEVTDDQVRYSGTPGGSDAGDGFQTLLPYFSSELNLGPDAGGDNSSDLLGYEPFTREVFLWNMHGNLIDPGAAVAVITEPGWIALGRGDYNGDGKADSLWQNALDNRLYMWLMDGSRILSSAPVATLTSSLWQIVGDGDYTGDGKSDIMFQNAATQQVYLWTMDGATITGAAQIAVLQDPNWLLVGDKDFDGDRIADLMWFNTVTGQVYFWKMNGTTIDSAALVATVSDLNWEVVSDGDLNGDGNADLTWQRRGAGQDGKVYYWQMNGATIQLSSRISIVGDQDWAILAPGDLNGDSRSDLVWFNITSREIYHWQQDGATTLRGGQITTALDPNWIALPGN